MKIAIYSRKSKYTGKGDSIGNQVQMCKDYIACHFPNEEHEFFEYEDEGFTGAVIDRPQFKNLMKDIETKKFDALICYRLDRISRTVDDFSSTLNLIQSYGTDFISIKEQFDTTTSMGRAMIYIASVFAQLERETIAERVRDNMMELAKNGKWSGGKLPLGYTSESTTFTDEEGNERKSVKLVPNNEELKLVKLIYDTYLKEGSLHKTEVYFTKNNIKSKSGTLLEKTSLKVILQNPIYVKSTEKVLNYLDKDGWNVYGTPDGESGILSYNKTKSIIKNGKYVKVNKDKEEWIAAVSNFPGIIDDETWIKVQEQFKDNTNLFPRLGKTNNALLTGKLRCAHCNSYMYVIHGRVSKKTGEKFYYYSCSLKKRSKGSLCSCKNIKADKIEEAVLKTLETLGGDKKVFLKSLLNNLSSNHTSELKTKKLSIEKQITDKNKILTGLLDKLALAPDISDIIMTRIKLIKDELKDLDFELNNVLRDLEFNSNEKFNLEFIDKLLSECINIKNLSKEKQKAIINILIDSILYDGETDDVHVIVHGAKGSKKKLI